MVGWEKAGTTHIPESKTAVPMDFLMDVKA
jgi:hypothetical protein